MEVQLRASEEDGDRLRKEREQLRERLSELQSTLREKEAEVSVTQAGPAQRGGCQPCFSAPPAGRAGAGPGVRAAKPEPLAPAESSEHGGGRTPGQPASTTFVSAQRNPTVTGLTCTYSGTSTDTHAHTYKNVSLLSILLLTRLKKPFWLTPSSSKPKTSR